MIREQTPILDVTARPIEHYKQIFPSQFSEDYQATGLIVGSGLSNSVLHPHFFSIDIGYSNLEVLKMRYYANFKNSKSVGQEQGFLHHTDNIKKGFYPSNLVAAEARSDYLLPFLKSIFDDIVSNNCIFGGLELSMGFEKTTQLILNICEHLKTTGQLHLFPYFFDRPSLQLDPYPNESEKILIHLSNVQNRIISQLQKLGYTISHFAASVDRQRNVEKIYTVSIRKE